MKTKEKKFWLTIALLCLINFAAHLYFYPKLPQTIPTHWGVSGQIDAYGPRWTTLVFSGLPLGMLVTFYFIPKIDPKGEAYKKIQGLWHNFIIATSCFFIILSWITEATVFGWIPQSSKVIPLLILCTVGVGLIALGNYLPRVRQNYSFGIKTPWALADEHCWQRTHRMGGITSIFMGVGLIICGLASDILQALAAPILTVILLGGVVWMYLYSYLVYAGKMR
ncbi:SdpI family protein [Olegusella massiliensis]|uniref:SdpI family protein n=1 Tax=Olegusella massiliensis TaxID=1776381 RepID=UPI00405573BF